MHRLNKALQAMTRAVSVIGVLGLCAMLPAKLHAASSVVDLKVPDLELTNQDGVSGHFVSDIIGDKLTAITFTYTTCTTICPVLDGIFKNVQTKIGEDLGGEVQLVTISIDPTTDIPARLKEHAEKLGAGPGWICLTGDKEKVNSVLKGLEMYSPDIFNHPPAVFIVDGRRGVWSRLSGFPSPKLIHKALDEYRSARGDS